MIASALILLLILAALYIASHELSGGQLLGVSAVFVLGIAMVVSPDLASKLASLVGVGRGTDLILYLAIIGGIFAAANFYFRARRSEKQIRIIVQEMAFLGGDLQVEVRSRIVAGLCADRIGDRVPRNGV